MNVRIGVTYTPKEIEIELGDDADRDKVMEQVKSALADDDGILWLTDRRGRTIGVPSERVAYVEISPDEERRVGFAVS